jgi:hypothetical protein
MLAGLSLVAGTRGEVSSDITPSPTASTTNETKAVEPVKPNAAPVFNANFLAPGKPGPTSISLSWQTGEIVKIAQSGVEPAVINAYVENCTAAVPPTVDEIIYLRDHGISPDTITAYIRRAQQLKAHAAANVQEIQGPAAPMEMPAATYPAVPPPVYPELTPPAYPESAYDYAAPTYVYVEPPPYLYPPPYYLGVYGPYYHPRTASHFSHPVYGHYARPQPWGGPGRNNHPPHPSPGVNQGNRVK